MKKTTRVLGIAVFGAALALTSCKKGCTDSNANNFDPKAKKDDSSCTYDQVTTTLSGDITSDMTLTKLDANGNVAIYTLAGGVHVKDGATLTIEPGVIVESDPNEAIAYLLVEQGGKIMAEGTAADPIVFTSGNTTKERGQWGGIIVCGRAPINQGTTATAEVGNVLYGGTDAADNSGVFKYVRVEYTGNAINASKEHNGFTFNGVGTGTQIDYLQAYMGGDDGFEFFGGTVDANHLVSTGSKDDSFDWTYGWVGNGSYWIAEQASDQGDRAIEADNNGNDNSVTPISNPTLMYVTLTGRGAAAGTQAMKLREGTKFSLTDVVIDAFDTAVSVQHSLTCSELASGGSSLSTLNVTNCTSNLEIANHANASDSTACATAITNAITGSATGAGTAWTSGWTASL